MEARKYHLNQRTTKPTVRCATSEDSDQPTHPHIVRNDLTSRKHTYMMLTPLNLTFIL